MLKDDGDVNDYFERNKTWLPDPDSPPPVQLTVNLQAVPEYPGDPRDVCQFDYKYYLLPRGLSDFQDKKLPFYVEWLQGLSGDSSEGIVTVLLFMKDWEPWRHVFARITLNET